MSSVRARIGILVFATLATLAAACSLSEDPGDPLDTSTEAAEAAAEAADQEAVTEVAAARAAAENAEEALNALLPPPQESFWCEPGPSSNWCQNVHGRACSTQNIRMCYLPNYCEWLHCVCEGGAWNCNPD